MLPALPFSLMSLLSSNFRRPIRTRFLEKKGKGGMFTSTWFDKSVIADTRKSITRTIETLRWDCMQQERVSSGASVAAPDGVGEAVAFCAAIVPGTRAPTAAIGGDGSEI